MKLVKESLFKFEKGFKF